MLEIIGFTILGAIVLITGFYTLEVLKGAKKYEAEYERPDVYIMAGYYTAAIFLGATCLISLAFLILK